MLASRVWRTPVPPLPSSRRAEGAEVEELWHRRGGSTTSPNQASRWSGADSTLVSHLWRMHM